MSSNSIGSRTPSRVFWRDTSQWSLWRSTRRTNHGLRRTSGVRWGADSGHGRRPDGWLPPPTQQSIPNEPETEDILLPAEGQRPAGDGFQEVVAAHQVNDGAQQGHLTTPGPRKCTDWWMFRGAGWESEPFFPVCVSPPAATDSWLLLPQSGRPLSPGQICDSAWGGGTQADETQSQQSYRIRWDPSMGLARLCTVLSWAHLRNIQQLSTWRVPPWALENSWCGAGGLPKKTPPTEVDSHLRPISLTPVVSKVLESFTCEWIKETIQDSINPRRYGAISGSSTTHALIEMLHFILSSLEKRSHHARALLLDYSKAFDSVNHHILLQKLHEAGSPAILTRWVAAFLLNRKQRVRIGDQYSSLLTLNGGTPQGTLFGPLSFIVHLGDFSTPCALDFIYVDDTSSCTASDKPDSPAMQANADYAALWARNNDMKLNAQKTLELVF